MIDVIEVVGMMGIALAGAVVFWAIAGGVIVLAVGGLFHGIETVWHFIRRGSDE